MSPPTRPKKARAGMADKEADDGSKDPSQGVMESSRSIWLAGLGAFSRAQAEGMRMFEGLVKQGEALALIVDASLGLDLKFTTSDVLSAGAFNLDLAVNRHAQ